MAADIGSGSQAISGDGRQQPGRLPGHAHHRGPERLQRRAHAGARADAGGGQLFTSLAIHWINAKQTEGPSLRNMPCLVTRLCHLLTRHCLRLGPHRLGVRRRLGDRPARCDRYRVQSQLPFAHTQAHLQTVFSAEAESSDASATGMPAAVIYLQWTFTSVWWAHSRSNACRLKGSAGEAVGSGYP